MPHRPRPVIALLAALAAAACKPAPADLGMSDSAYVQVMAELRVVADQPNVDKGLRAQRRAAVFRKHGVDAARLERIAAELEREPQRAADLWRRIDDKAATLRPGAGS